MGSMKIKYNNGAIASPSKDDGYFPSITITDKAVPELKDKKMGETCKIVFTGKIKSMRDDKSGMSFEFEARDAKYYEEE